MTLPIKELRAKAEAATRGPWEIGDGCVQSVHDNHPLVTIGQCDEDETYIAAASPDVVIALLDRIATLTALAGEACDLAMNERWTSKPVEYRAEMVRRIHEIRAELAGKERGE